MQKSDENVLKPQEAVPFYPCLVPMCGGLAPALLFCWYEQIHRAAGYPGSGVLRPKLRDWRTGLGYDLPQPWYCHFYRIGTIHRGSESFAVARRVRREFVSVQNGDYVFYALEITRYGGPCILHRNGPLIERRLGELSGVKTPPPLVPELSSSWNRARADAARISTTVTENVDFHAKACE